MSLCSVPPTQRPGIQSAPKRERKKKEKKEGKKKKKKERNCNAALAEGSAPVRAFVVSLSNIGVSHAEATTSLEVIPGILVHEEGDASGR